MNRLLSMTPSAIRSREYRATAIGKAKIRAAQKRCSSTKRGKAKRKIYNARWRHSPSGRIATRASQARYRATAKGAAARKRRKDKIYRDVPPHSPLVRCNRCRSEYYLNALDHGITKRVNELSRQSMLRFRPHPLDNFSTVFLCEDCIHENDIVESKFPTEDQFLALEEEGDLAAIYRFAIEDGISLCHRHVPEFRPPAAPSPQTVEWYTTERIASGFHLDLHAEEKSHFGVAIHRNKSKNKTQ